MSASSPVSWACRGSGREAFPRSGWRRIALVWSPRPVSWSHQTSGGRMPRRPPPPPPPPTQARARSRPCSIPQKIPKRPSNRGSRSPSDRRLATFPSDPQFSPRPQRKWRSVSLLQGCSSLLVLTWEYHLRRLLPKRPDEGTCQRRRNYK